MAVPGMPFPMTSVLAFDLYDTILDRRSTLVPAIGTVLDAYDADVDPAVFLRRYLAKHFRDSLIDSLVGGAHTPFAEITRRALRYRFDQLDVPATDADIAGIVDAWTTFDAYEDSIEPLQRLGESYDLVGLSNGDPDMPEAVAADLAIDFDALVSVAEAGRYKPHPGPYEVCCERMGVDPPAVTFISAHTFDIVGAEAIGMDTIYLNRHGRPFGEWPQQPGREVATPADLAEALLD